MPFQKRRRKRKANVLKPRERFAVSAAIEKRAVVERSVGGKGTSARERHSNTSGQEAGCYRLGETDVAIQF
jgi:hypothetical protein